MKRVLSLLAISPIMVIIMGPLIAMAILSLVDARFPTVPWPGWSLRWYTELYHDNTLLESLARSAKVGLIVGLCSGTLGFSCAYWLARLPSQVGERFLVALTIPAIVPFILFGYCFSTFSNLIGFGRTTFAVVVAHIVVFTPVALALCYRRLRQLDMDIENAARELGASELRIFAHIVGGQGWQTIVASQIVVFVLSWDEYIISWFASGFNKTYPVQVRNMLESTMSPEVNAVGSIVAILSFLLVGLAIFLMRRH